MTHTTTDIYEVAAAGPGALDGFAFDCSCGNHEAYSVRSMTEDARRRHLEYFERRPDCRWNCTVNHGHKLGAAALRKRFGLCEDLSTCTHFVRCR